MKRPGRMSLGMTAGAGVVACALAVAWAMPVAGQDPTPTPSPSPAATDKPGKGPKVEQGPKVPEVAVTLSGRIGTRTDVGGDTSYTLTVAAGTVYDLHLGPPWWWGADHPLAGLAGTTATITGERAEGSTAVDVLTVNGETVRQPGRPPWAGGWKAVGERHPGWAQWKVDKLADKAQGRAVGRPPWAGPKTPEGSGD